MVTLRLKAIPMGSVVSIRDSNLRPVATLVGDASAEEQLNRGVYLVELSRPDGRRIRRTVELEERDVVVDFDDAKKPTGAKRSGGQAGSAVAHRHSESKDIGPVHVGPRVRTLRPTRGVRPQKLVADAGRPLARADTRIGSYLDTLSEAAFTGHVEVFEGDAASRFIFKHGEVADVRFGGLELEKTVEFLQHVKSLRLQDAQVNVQRKGYFVSAWRRDGGAWYPERVKRGPLDLRVARAADTVALLQVISPERSEFVTYSPRLPEARLATDADGRAEVRFEATAQALMQFVYHGDRQAASALARHLLWKKYDNPVLGCIGGYFLLEGTWGDQTELDVPDHWWRNLASFEWLPDGAILAGWAALRADRGAEAQAHFLRAAERGVPLFTRGLLLLLDGLWAFADESACTAAADKLRPYAECARRAAVVTTFGGASPEKPTRLEAPVAAPESALPVMKGALAIGFSLGTD